MQTVDIIKLSLGCTDDERAHAARLAALRRLQRGQVAEARRIRAIVADRYGLTPAQLRSPCRQRTIAEARQVAMYLMRTDVHWPLGTGARARNEPFPAQRIGHLLGGRDHTTVLYGVGAIAVRLAGDHTLRYMVRAIRATLDATYEGREG